MYLFFILGRIRSKSLLCARFQVVLSAASNCSKNNSTSRTSCVGVLAPAVTATFFASLIHSISNSVISAIRYAFVPAFSIETWAKRAVLLLLGSPTTIVRSAPLAVLQQLLAALEWPYIFLDVE